MLAQSLLLLSIVVVTTTGKRPDFDLLTFEDIKDLFFNLDEGEACLSSFQCKPEMCCQRDTFLLGSRTCRRYSRETEACQVQHPYDLYYACPCRAGLTCMVSHSDPFASVLNTEVGVCSAGGDPIFTGR